MMSVVRVQPSLLDLLEPEVAVECQRHAEAIRVLGKRIASDIVEIGTRLIAVKAALPHGAWLPWLDVEFGWSISAANKFMAVAEQFKSVNFTDLALTIDASTLYALSGPNVATELRAAVIAEAQDGTRITREEADRIAADLVAKKHRELTAKFKVDNQAIHDAFEILRDKVEELALSLDSPCVS